MPERIGIGNTELECDDIQIGRHGREHTYREQTTGYGMSSQAQRSSDWNRGVGDYRWHVRRLCRCMTMENRARSSLIGHDYSQSKHLLALPDEQVSADKIDLIGSARINESLQGFPLYGRHIPLMQIKFQEEAQLVVLGLGDTCLKSVLLSAYK